MSAVIVRLPEEKRDRLKALAHARGTSVNKLMEEMMTILIANIDAETRFRLRASRGDVNHESRYWSAPARSAAHRDRNDQAAFARQRHEICVTQTNR
jgi:hypothetical protein